MQLPEKKIEKLHYLTQDGVRNCSHADLAEMACQGGVKWVQLRAKGHTQDEWETIAREVKEVTERHQARLIINDNVQLAQKIGADGVHLGKGDMPPAEARAILGEQAIIGGTANTQEDIERLVTTGVDYIGLGPFRFTSTKKNLSPVINPQTLIRLLGLQHKVPVILIGGIQLEDVETALDYGAHGVAVSSAINFSNDKTKMAAQFLEKLN